jgi:hypothetical protein
MERKTFIQRSLGALLIALPAISLVGCSSSDDSSGEPNPNPDPNPNGSQGNCVENGTNSAISANHGHTLTVSKDDVTQGVEKTYSIEGSSDHNHNVTLTADDFVSLQGNNSITVGSTAGGGHTHNVTVSCA